MKTFFTTSLALIAGISLAHAQGTVSIANALTSAYLIETNASAPYIPGISHPITGSATARTAATLNSFFYEVLTTTTGANTSGGAPTQAPATLNPFDVSWLDTGVGGKNSAVTSGAITGVGGPATANGTWAAPTGSFYSDGSVQWYLIVGWSSNLGTTWSDAKVNKFLVTEGFFGQSPLAYQVAGGGPASLPPVNLWGNGTGISGAGLSGGFALDMLMPEPSSFTLVAFGASAMFAARRRK